MGKYLTESGWKQIVKKHGAKDDGLQEALGEYEDYEKRDDPNEYSDRLAALKEVNDIAGKLKKDKKLAGDEVTKELIIKHLDGMSKEATAEIKKVFAAKKKYEADSVKSGLKSADVQVTAYNWDGELMRNYQAYVEFVASGFKKVTLGKVFKGGIVSFDDVQIPPEGLMRLTAVSKGAATLAPSGVSKYKLPSNGKLQFEATQEKDEAKLTANSGDEASDKAGATGSAGIDWKIFSAGVEITKEQERKKTHSVGVEYVVKWGKSSFKVTN
jgi:hypothetical protein